MSIEALIIILETVEVDARKARDLSKNISEDTANPTQVALNILEEHSRQTLVGVCNALREAKALKAEAKKEESK